MKPTTFLSIIGISILFLLAYFQFNLKNSETARVVEGNKDSSLVEIALVEDEKEVSVDEELVIDDDNRKSRPFPSVNKRRKECFDLNESTIALWRFNGEVENSFKNEKNNVLGRFLGNPTMVKGKFGDAVHFDGIDDYGNCNFDPPEKNCTYEIWYKPDAQADENGWVWMGWGLYNSGLIVNQNKVALCEFKAVQKKKENFSLIPNTWNYVVYVFSDNPELQALYINGEKVSNLEIARHESTWNTLWLAADMTYGANHFIKGTIDEFRISNKALTDKEIKKCWKRNN
jgi:hypothetical protein